MKSPDTIYHLFNYPHLGVTKPRYAAESDRQFEMQVFQRVDSVEQATSPQAVVSDLCRPSEAPRQTWGSNGGAAASASETTGRGLEARASSQPTDPPSLLPGPLLSLPAVLTLAPSALGVSRSPAILYKSSILVELP